MAQFGEERIKRGIMYLATIKADGYPRVHPFTPFIASGRLFSFMYATSPKCKDLQKNGRYSIHSLVVDAGGPSGEFQITGDALVLSDPASRQVAAAAAPYPLSELPTVLFEFKIMSCLTNFYTDGQPNPKRWKHQAKAPV